MYVSVYMSIYIYIYNIYMCVCLYIYLPSGTIFETGLLKPWEIIPKVGGPYFSSADISFLNSREDKKPDMWQPVRINICSFIYFQPVIATTEMWILSWIILGNSGLSQRRKAYKKLTNLCASPPRSLPASPTKHVLQQKKKYSYKQDIT